MTYNESSATLLHFLVFTGKSNIATCNLGQTYTASALDSSGYPDQYPPFDGKGTAAPYSLVAYRLVKCFLYFMSTATVTVGDS